MPALASRGPIWKLSLEPCIFGEASVAEGAVRLRVVVPGDVLDDRSPGRSIVPPRGRGGHREVGPGRARQKGAERNVFAATRRTYSRTAAHVQVRCIWSQDQMRAGVHNHGLVTGSCCSVSPEEATAQWLGA